VISSGVNIIFIGNTHIAIGAGDTLKVSGVTFTGNNYANIKFGEGSYGYVEYCDFDGVFIFCQGESSPTISENTISNTYVGIFLKDDPSPVISNNIITNNDFGIQCDGSANPGVSISNNFIFNNLIGIENKTSNHIIAEYNWWGSASGPKNSSNPGALGDSVKGDVDFEPWLINPYTDVIEIDNPKLPNNYELLQNYPNPFNSETHIEFSISKRSYVVLEIYNIIGQIVKTLADNELSAGHKYVLWDGTDNSGQPVSSGVYIYRISANSFTQELKMVLIK